MILVTLYIKKGRVRFPLWQCATLSRRKCLSSGFVVDHFPCLLVDITVSGTTFGNLIFYIYLVMQMTRHKMSGGDFLRLRNFLCTNVHRLFAARVEFTPSRGFQHIAHQPFNWRKKLRLRIEPGN